MKDDRFREELNNTSVTDMLSAEEIAAVEAMYLETLDAEVPDIWNRIEAGIRAEGLDSTSTLTSEPVKSTAPTPEQRMAPTPVRAGNNAAQVQAGKNMVPVQPKNGTVPAENGKVVSLADRRRKRRTFFTAIGAAAAILLVMIPATMFGGTRNDKKSSKDNKSSVAYSEDSENGSVELGGSGNGESHNLSYEPNTSYKTGSKDGDKDSMNDKRADEIAYSTESTTTGDMVEVDEYDDFFEDGQIYQIKAEGELYLSDDFKVILETATDSKYEIVNIEVFDEPVIAELKKSGRIKVWIKGNFDENGESGRRVIISDYKRADR